MRHMQGKALRQTAVTGRAQPRGKAAGMRCAHRDPDLLEGTPVIRRALVAEEPGAVPLLKPQVHLEAAPIRATRIGPASLVAMDAEPGAERRWMRRAQPRPVRHVLPAPFESPEPGKRVPGQLARPARRRPTVHDREPVPRVGAETSNVASPDGCRPQLPTRGACLGRGRHDGRARRRGGAWAGFALF